MADTSEGSSSAAQSAPPSRDIPQSSKKPGFFGRIFFTRSSGDEDPAPIEAPARHIPTGHGMVNLRKLRVEDVMIPKVEITSVPSDITRADLVQVFRDSGLTRLPVYEGTLDSPKGMVHLKDFALKFGFNGSKGFKLQDAMRAVLYVPPSMPIGVLLQKMQSDRTHMALVIDEYGGVDGLVTIEDLIEQVIGEIEDEHDTADAQQWSEEKPGSYLALATTPLDEFEDVIGRSLTDDLDDDEIDTLGGLVFVLTGRVPARGEVVPHPSGAEFEVVDADPRRIKRLRVRTG